MEQITINENISGKLTSIESVSIDKKTPNKIIIRGCLLPKDQISRNNVLYDWESIQLNHEKLLNASMLYNHLNETADKPVGHFTDSILLEREPSEDSKWYSAWMKTKLEAKKEVPGWYYEADVNPESEYANSVLRGDLKRVSIQVMAKSSREESTDDGRTYIRAFIGDVLESSLVPTPGFADTSIEVALAEAFKAKEKLSHSQEGEVYSIAEDELRDHGNIKRAVDYALSYVGSKFDDKMSSKDYDELHKKLTRDLTKDKANIMNEAGQTSITNPGALVAKMKDDEEEKEEALTSFKKGGLYRIEDKDGHGKTKNYYYMGKDKLQQHVFRPVGESSDEKDIAYSQRAHKVTLVSESSESASSLSYTEQKFFEEFTIGLYQELSTKESQEFNDYVESAKEALQKLQENDNAYNRVERLLEGLSDEELKRF